MPQFAQLRGRVTPEARAFYDFLWKHFLAAKEWPTGWQVYRDHLEKPQLTKVLRRSNGSLVIENESSGQSTYDLRLPGILCTTQGDTYREWLKQFVAYLREVFYDPVKVTTVAHIDVMKALSLSSADVLVLGRILQVGFMGVYAVWSPDSLGWQVILPTRNLEDLPRRGSIDVQFRRLLDADCERNVKISARDRALQMANTPMFFLGDDDDAAASDSTRPRRYQVFVSSTHDDLIDARQGVIRALLESNCIPAGMELFPAANVGQWKLIQRVIAESDYYIVIVAGRYGSCPPRSKISYTEREFDYAKRRGKPILGFYHASPGSIPKKDSEESAAGRKRLDKFVSKVKLKLCKSWNTPSDLAGAVRSAIQHAIIDTPQPGWVRASTTRR